MAAINPELEITDQVLSEFFEKIKDPQVNPDVVGEYVTRYGKGILNSTLTDDFETALIKAIDAGIDNDAAITLFQPYFNEMTDDDLQLAFNHAVALGRLEAVKLLYATNKINLELDGDATPLHLAAQYGHVNVANFLINEGASQLVLSRDSLYPIHCAIQENRPQVVRSLLEGSEDLVNACLPLRDDEDPDFRSLYAGMNLGAFAQAVGADHSITDVLREAGVTFPVARTESVSTESDDGCKEAVLTDSESNSLTTN